MVTSGSGELQTEILSTIFPIGHWRVERGLFGSGEEDRWVVFLELHVEGWKFVSRSMYWRNLDNQELEEVARTMVWRIMDGLFHWVPPPVRA